MTEKQADALITIYESMDERQREALDNNREDDIVELRQLVCDAYQLRNAMACHRM